jgi:threonine dehydrogenase-like Zn-dependent dehydrogenase
MLARVDAAGICTSLIKLIEQGNQHRLLYGWDISRWPVILGDEGSVTLVQVGEALQKNFHPGQRFVIQPAVDCRPINFPQRYTDGGRGIQKVAVGYTLGGHLAEYLLITEEILEAGCLLPMPGNHIPYSHAAMAEPISCVISAQDHHMHLVQRNGLDPRSALKGLVPGGTTVIVGAGVMGRFHLEIALTYHPHTVIVADFINERLELANQLFGLRAEQAGVALHIVNSRTTDLKMVVMEQTHYRGADDVIIAVGARQAIEEAMAYVGRGAALNMFAGFKKGDEIIGFDTGVIHYQSINITGSSGGSPWDIARTLELIADHSICPEAHITRIGDLEHAPVFLKQINGQQIDGKAIVYPHRRSDQISVVRSWSAQDEASYLQNCS